MSDPVLVGCLAVGLLLPLVVAYFGYVLGEEGPNPMWLRLVMPVLWLSSVGLLFGLAYVGDNHFGSGSIDNSYWIYWLLAAMSAIGSAFILFKELRE
jgi:Na+-transporting NADH:ubiquinone oxidoreductase subunit NqrB